MFGQKKSKKLLAPSSTKISCQFSFELIKAHVEKFQEKSAGIPFNLVIGLHSLHHEQSHAIFWNLFAHFARDFIVTLRISLLPF